MHLAAGRALTRRGDLAKAQEQLEWALELFAIDGMAVLRAHALLLLVAARHGHGDLPGARALLQQAHELVERLADPGMLPGQLRRSGRMLDSGPGRRVRMGVPLTERELAVLRLLPSRLSTREIGGELYVSVNTVRSQVQAVYRKLEVTSRAEAVTQARRLGLVPGPNPEGKAISPR